MTRVRRYFFLAVMIVLGITAAFPDDLCDPMVQQKYSRIYNLPLYTRLTGKVKVTGNTDTAAASMISGIQTKAVQKPTKDEKKKQPVRSIPSGIHLSQNRPNPFNPVTTISFSLPERQYVQLKVYDLLGKEVAVLDEGLREAGIHTVRFSGKELPSSMYFYALITNTGFRSVKRMLLVK